MKFTLCRRMFALTVIIFAFASLALGQESRATLTGRVADPNGAGVPGATVTVKNQQTNIETTVTTSGDGNYTIPLLQPGRYTVTVEAQGFKRAESNMVELHTADKATFDVTLEIGQVGEVVTVNDEAPLLEADTASRGQVIERERISELPLVGRNPLNLATLAPGVTFNGNPTFQRPFDNGDNVNFSINGGLNRHNDFLLDGTPNNALTDVAGNRTTSSNNIAFVPSAEATEEFKVQTNAYDAQFGRTGGGTINITVRSGGSQFHGSIYEFARRYQLNANTFRNNAAGLQTSGPCAGLQVAERFQYNRFTCENLGGNKIDQYGLVVSGPLYFPRFGEGGRPVLGSKEKTFFLFNAENYHEITPVQGSTTVPTLLERQGDFSQSGITIYDPLTTTCNSAGVCTRQAFPGNIIPANRISPVGSAIANSFPVPNIPGQRFNNLYVTGAANGTDRFHSFIARVDHQYSQNQRFFIRYVENRRDQFQISDANFRTGLGVDEQGPLVRKNNGVVVDSTTTLSPTSILNVRLGFTRFLQAAFRQKASPFDATSIGFSPAFSNARPVSIVPRVTFSDPAGNIPEFGSRNPNSNITNTWSVPAYLTHIRGNHTFKFGGEYRRFQINQAGGSFNFGGGVFCFNGQYTAADPNNVRGGAAANRGAAFADLLLGAPSSNGPQCNGNGPVTQLENITPTTFQWGYYAGYVQDDFKVTPRLTLNLGLRYDYEAPPVERFNRQNRGFALNTASPLASVVSGASTANCPSCSNLTGGLLFAGVNGQPRGAFEPDRNNIQPRVGVAYQLNTKTVLRGGYGLYYFPSAEYGGTTGFSVVTPFSGTVGGTTAGQFIPRADAFSNPFPAGLATPTGSSLGQLTSLGSSVTFANPQRRIPHIHQFSAGIQRELPFRMKLDVSYVGSRSRDIVTGDQQGAGGRNLNVLSAAQLAQARQDPSFLTTNVANPFAGRIPNNPQLNAATVPRSLLLLPFPQFGAVTIIGENFGTLDYNSLQATVEKRLSRGLVGVVSYTFSKNIGALGFLNDQDAAPTRSVVNFDSPHVLSVSAVYKLPFGKGERYFNGGGRALELLVGGFEYNIIGSYRSGVPIDLPGGVDLIADPRISNPDIANPFVPNYSGSYFNNCVRQLNGTSLQFVSNAAGQRVQQTCTNPAFALRAPNTLRSIPFRLGNLRQPTRPTFDMSINKSLNFNERLRFQLRLEAFNVFNSPLFGSPDTNPTSQTFGLLNPNNGQRNLARQLQLGFKFIF